MRIDVSSVTPRILHTTVKIHFDNCKQLLEYLILICNNDLIAYLCEKAYLYVYIVVCMQKLISLNLNGDSQVLIKVNKSIITLLISSFINFEIHSPRFPFKIGTV